MAGIAHNALLALPRTAISACFTALELNVCF
jgi:hypothetical protein